MKSVSCLIIIDVMKKRTLATMLAFLLMCFFTGCSAEPEAEVTTIKIAEDGKVSQTIVEEFSSEEYDGTELRESIKAQVEEYNRSSGGESARLERFDVLEGKVRVVLSYSSVKDFVQLNDASPAYFYFYGTVAQASDQGLIPEVMLYQGGKLGSAGVNANGIRKYPDRHLMILMESAHVELPGNILFCSENVSPKDQKEADVVITGEGEKAYILTE